MSGRRSFDYVRDQYGVPAARGVRVVVDGRPGRITSGAGHYIRVLFDAYPSRAVRCHPTWHVRYYVDAPELCVCRPDEEYCGAWDCRHDPAAAAGGATTP